MFDSPRDLLSRGAVHIQERGSPHFEMGGDEVGHFELGGEEVNPETNPDRLRFFTTTTTRFEHKLKEDKVQGLAVRVDDFFQAFQLSQKESPVFADRDLQALQRTGQLRGFNFNMSRDTLSLRLETLDKVQHLVHISLGKDRLGEEQADAWERLKAAFYDSTKFKRPTKEADFRTDEMGPTDGSRAFSCETPKGIRDFQETGFLHTENKLDKDVHRALSELHGPDHADVADAQYILGRERHRYSTILKRSLERAFNAELTHIETQIPQAQTDSARAYWQQKHHHMTALIQRLQRLKMLELELASVFAQRQATLQDQIEYYNTVYAQFEQMYHNLARGHIRNRNPQLDAAGHEYFLQVLALCEDQWRDAVDQIFHKKRKATNTFADPSLERMFMQIARMKADGEVPQEAHEEMIGEILQRNLEKMFSSYFSEVEADERQAFIEEIKEEVIRDLQGQQPPLPPRQGPPPRNVGLFGNGKRPSLFGRPKPKPKSEAHEMPVVRHPSRQQRRQALHQADAFEEVVTSSDSDT